jgi:hypothetical protein
MPLFWSRQQGKDAGKLTRFPGGNAASLQESLPDVARHLAGLAQKAAIRLYRKIHSHETGVFLSVRDECLFLLCHFFRQNLASSHAKDAEEMLWSAFQEHLTKVLSERQQDFDVAAFWETEAQRTARYDLCAPPDREIALSGPAVVSFFAECQTLHLGPELAAKISHFSEQVLKDLERDL